MRNLLLAALVCVASAFAPAPDDPPAPAAPKMDPVKVYFAKLGLHVDSAQTPHLYYEVHDWIGTRYKYGGHTQKGIDCSGFVAAMYRSAYCIKLSGGSRDLWPLVDSVPRHELKEGDILFFKIRKGQISHVGVYLGNDKFAHASVHSGVVVSDLKEEYYRKYYFAGGRLKAPVYIQ
ncbi:MAG: NlpC/P60 family protein [Bacteroidia bacterium]|jgi:lipoprotein Spr|nr:NlpC/P60 family protein [Bacteroidia bacterium]